MRLIKKIDKKLIFIFLAMLGCAEVLPKRTGGVAPAQPAPTAQSTASPVPQPQPAVPARGQTQPTAPITRQPQPTTTATPKTQPATPVKPQTQAAPVATQVQLPKITPRHEKYTQMEAYLESDKLRQLITEKYYGNYEVVKHMDLVSRVIAAEAELRDTHWAFYHGTTNDWTVWQDAYTKLRNHFNPSKAAEWEKDFFFLRVPQGTRNIKNFLVENLREYGLVDDTGTMKALLLSTNIFLFANTAVGSGKESTWRYVMDKISHAEPKAEYYTSIMDEFGLSHQYIGELVALAKQIDQEMSTQRQTLLQIFVPKSMVDSVAYLAWSQGVPANDKVISWVQKNERHLNKEQPKDPVTGLKKMSSAMYALSRLRDDFKNEQEKNGDFKDMLDGVETGMYSVDDYLKKCCNDPKAAGDLNGGGIQARLLFTDDILLNPASGIKMYRYTGMSHEQKKRYEAQLDAIIKKCIATRK